MDDERQRMDGGGWTKDEAGTGFLMWGGKFFFGKQRWEHGQFGEKWGVETDKRWLKEG
jgi:hypothetical protein